MPTPPNRFLLALLCGAALLPLASLAALFPSFPHLGMFHDDAIYLASARSLVADTGYAIPFLPGVPAQTKYPPLFPALLALGGGDIDGAAGWPLLLNSLLHTMLLGSWWVLFRKLGFSPLWAGGLTACCGWNVSLAVFSVSLTAEPLLALGVALTLVVFWRAGEQGGGTGLAALAGLLAGLAFLAKTAALAAAFAGVGWLVTRRRWRLASAALGGFLPVAGAWFVWRAIQSAPQSSVVLTYYTDYFRYQLLNVQWTDYPGVMARNLILAIPPAVNQLGFQLTVGVFGLCAGLLVLFAAVRGFLRLGRQGLTPAHWFAALYLPLILLWHFPPNERFLLPLAPLLAAGLAHSLREIHSFSQGLRRHSALSARTAGFAGMALALAVPAVLTAANASGVFRQGPLQIREAAKRTQRALPAYQWIRANLPPTAQLLAYDDALVYLHAGRQAVRIPTETRPFYREGPAAMRRQVSDPVGFARRHRLTYLLLAPGDYSDRLDRSGQKWFYTSVREHPSLRRIFAQNDVQIFEILPGN